MGPLKLIGPAGERVIDSFAYYKNYTWGDHTSWTTSYPGTSAQPWLKLHCPANTSQTTTATRPPGATPSLNYVFQQYEYTHLRMAYMVDNDFYVSNTQGATASGGGYASSLYLNAGIPLSSSFGAVTNSFRPVFNDIVADTSPEGDHRAPSTTLRLRC